jgi:hypothetical protein
LPPQLLSSTTTDEATARLAVLKGWLYQGRLDSRFMKLLLCLIQ